MDSTGQSLLKLLFDAGETICVSHNEFGYHSIPLENAFKDPVILIPTEESLVKRKLPLEKGIERIDSNRLILCALNPIKGFRQDENATAYRSFLVELDTGTIKEQLGTIEHLKMPFSAQVFSGNKSVHTIITLDEDLTDEKTYRNIAEWIFNIVPKVDDKCKNPSRSVRIPGAYRGPGKKQRLIKLNRRISHKELFDWLGKYEHLRPVVKPKKVVVPGQEDFSKLSPWCRYMLKNGMDFRRGRNQTWYAIAYDFALAGFTEEKTIDILSQYFEEDRDFKEKEWLTAIGSAFKKVGEIG